MCAMFLSSQTDSVLTRERLAELLQGEGLRVTARTLRYWETSGKMPKAQRRGRISIYPDDIIPLARTLAATRPAVVAALREQAKSSRSNGKESPVTTMTSDGSMVVLTIHYHPGSREHYG